MLLQRIKSVLLDKQLPCDIYTNIIETRAMHCSYTTLLYGGNSIRLLLVSQYTSLLQIIKQLFYSVSFFFIS